MRRCVWRGFSAGCLDVGWERPNSCSTVALALQVLGHTLPEIAAEKAGIFKRGASAVTVPQRPDAMQTLMVCACASGCLTVILCVAGICKCS